jgi:type VI secretion system secreted protein Hcp
VTASATPISPRFEKNLNGKYHQTFAMKINLSLRSKFAPLFSSISFLLLFIAAQPSRAADMFIKWGAAPGESRDVAFPAADGWNELLSASWNVEAQTSWTAGGGASVGKPNPGAFVITKKVDAASPTFFSMIATGKSAPSAEIVVRDPSRVIGKEAQTPYLRYEFTGGFVTSISPSVSAGDNTAVETISFVFKTVKMTYRPISASGTLGTPIVITWDIPAGTATVL